MANTETLSDKKFEAIRLRVGFIGAGGIAQGRHIKEAALNPRAEIVALCDVNLPRAQTVANEYGVNEVFEDYRQMLSQVPFDLIVICTPSALHAPQSIDASKAGCHVLVEKPMAGSEADAVAMIDAAQRNDKWLMIGQNQRLMSPHVLAKKILASGELGRVLNFQTTFKHPGPGFWSADGANTWFYQRKPAVMGVCGDLGVHKVDLLMYLLGEPIVSVNGFMDALYHKQPSGQPIEVEDTAFFTVRTTSGVIGTVNLSWTHFGRSEDNGTTIYCEHGVLSLANDPEFSVVIHRSDGTKTFHKTGAIATNTQQVASGVIDEMIDAILGNRRPLIDGNEGLRALRVILAAIKAAESGMTVTINHD